MPSTENDALVDELVAGGHLKTPRIIEAFRKVDRADFVLDEYRGEAYGNYPLPIGFHQTISQPLTVAFMLELLDAGPGDHVLEIGAGSGWMTSLLSYIVSREDAKGPAEEKRVPHRVGHVVAVERLPELAEMATQNVAKYDFIEHKVASIVFGDGSKGYPREAPFTRVIAAATSGKIPVAWKEQCRIKGKIVAPVGEIIELYDKLGGTDYLIKEYAGFKFVPLVTDDAGGG